MEEQIDNAFTRPAGLVWSTAEDQVRLAAFLLDGDPDVLSDALRTDLVTPHVPLYPTIDADALGYGYGLMVARGWSAGSDYYATPIWQHGGNTLGMTSAFFVLPDQRLAVSILSNGYGDDFSGTAVAALVGLGDLPDPVEAPEQLQPPPDDLSVYAGTWEDPYTLGTVEITWDAGNLRVAAPDLAEQGIAVGGVAQVAALDLVTLQIDGIDHTMPVYRDHGDPRWMADRSFVLTRAATANPGRPIRPYRRGSPTPRPAWLGPVPVR